MAGHQREAPLLGQLGSPSASADDAASGFSTKTCLPLSSARLASGKCVDDRRGDHDRVEPVVREEVAEVGRAADAQDSGGRSARADPPEVADPGDLAPPSRRASCGRDSGPSIRVRQRRRGASDRSCRCPPLAKSCPACGRGAEDRGRATSRERRRHPCRAPRRKSSVPARSPARAR